jgi:16S rRNA (adenine(1408)-N(1))-methyltransferase
MRILQARKVIEAPAGWRASIDVDGRPVVIDLGAGDGRFAYESARADPGSLYVAADPDAESLGDYAFRAARKPARGGVENAVFVVAAVEALPPELLAIATRVRINFPWGSLMRGLLEPDPRVLAAIQSLLRPAGLIEVIVSYDQEHDPNAFAGEPLPPLDASYIQNTLVPAYEDEGLHVTEQRRLTQDEALAVPSTWGRRLLHARPRDVYFLTLVPEASR